MPCESEYPMPPPNCPGSPSVISKSTSTRSGLPATGFKLKLRIINAASDNLLQDLKEFPLSKKQVLEEEQGTDNYILSAPGTRATHQLSEWIVGRLDRVEVLAPPKFRTYIADRIAAVHRLYT